jgi:tetratricopeptide (TPR) repeat protein
MCLVNCLAARHAHEQQTTDNKRRFHYETEAYKDSEAMVEISLGVLGVSTADTLLHANAWNMLGLIKLDLGYADEALPHLQKALGIRKALLDPDYWGIGVSMGNVGLAFIELNDADAALDALTQTLEFRKRINCRMMDNVWANLASLYLRMGDAEKAERTYRSIPGLEKIDDPDFLTDDKPRYSG